MTRRDAVTLTLDRTILEHPRAFHIRRLRSTIWLYLVLLSYLRTGEDTVEIEIDSIVHSMGLSEGTVRSWLGQLKKFRYIAVDRRNESVLIRFKRLQIAPRVAQAKRTFTVTSLGRALGEVGHEEVLTAALTRYPPDAIERALGRATDVPRSKIRRSRTALFLYLLNHDEDQTNNSRH